MVAEIPDVFGAHIQAAITYSRVRPHQTRKRILEVAREQLAQISFSEFSISSLSRALGISKTAIYNQFLDKKEIYRESRRELIVSLTLDHCEEIPGSMEPLDALTYFSMKLIELHSDTRMDELTGSILRDMATQPWLPKTVAQMIRNPMMISLESYLLRHGLTEQASIKAPINIANFIWAITADLAMRTRQTNTIFPPSAINAEVGTFVKAFCTLITSPIVSLPTPIGLPRFPSHAGTRKERARAS